MTYNTIDNIAYSNITFYIGKYLLEKTHDAYEIADIVKTLKVLWAEDEKQRIDL